MNTLDQAKRDFKIGYLNTWRIQRAPLGGFMLDLGEGLARGWLVDARTKEPRVFKSLDSAVSTLETIGFEINILCQS